MQRLGVAVLLMIGAVLPPPACAQSLDKTRIDAIERAVTGFMTAHHVPGLSIAVVVDGKPAWSAGYGLADLENMVPAKASTAYRSASIGKSMTATAAMFTISCTSAPCSRTCTGWRMPMRIGPMAVAPPS